MESAPFVRGPATNWRSVRNPWLLPRRPLLRPWALVSERMPRPGAVEPSRGDGHGGPIGWPAEHVGERHHDAVVLRSGARGDTEIALSVQAALVGAVADVDAVAGEQLGCDGRRGPVELEEGGVRRARKGPHGGQRGELVEEAPGIAHIAAARGLVGLLVVPVVEQLAEPLCERIDVP